MSIELNKLSSWLDFKIKNQEQIKLESKPMELPEWNKGYLEALLDVKKEMLYNS